MKRFLPLIMLLMTGSAVAPARADLIHRMSSSTQLTVNGAYTDASRIGSTYAVSGSNIKVDTSNSGHFGALTAGSATAAPTLDVGTYDVNTYIKWWSIRLLFLYLLYYPLYLLL